ncbi:MAG: 4-hydroxy-tetrahydrodipicolinate synthase [Desulfobacterales bacterium]|nr:MAG: 4-hydroxy-tetrahydrodipicolinate synthase [Desulfobacterales bacterium]
MSKMMIKGSFVALITPFKDDGSVDIEGFRRLIEFQALNGTGALLIMGSTGEVSLLSKEERQQVISETVKFRQDGMPLFYGCTGNNTQETIKMVEFAAKAGADGAIVTVPSYIYAPVDAAIRYFLEVADASPIPVGIYNNPVRVGTDLPADAIIELADHPNIVIDKEAMARPGQIAQILAAKKDMSLMCCDSPNLGLVPAVMSLGGHGTANMSGNIAPREMAVISRPWETYADAVNFRQTYLKLLPLIQFNYSRVNPVPVKSLAKALGLPAGNLRKPYLNMTGQALQRGVEIARNLGLVEQYNFQVKEEDFVDRKETAPPNASADSRAQMATGKCFVD